MRRREPARARPIADVLVAVGIALVLGVLATVEWRIGVGLLGLLLIAVGEGWPGASPRDGPGAPRG